jgi:iron complex outermembrane receptor protein
MHTFRATTAAVLVSTVLFCGTPIVCAQTATTFDIPAQPLANALRTLGRQAGANVLFDPPLVDGLNAPELRAELTLDEALTRLLSGTGLKHRFVDSKTIMVVAGENSAQESESSGPTGEKSSNVRPAGRPSASSEADVSKGIQEIIVTAQRRAENQQDVPIAITTQTAEMLESVRISNTQELGQVVPNLSTTREGTTQITFLRGIGTAIGGAGQEPSVAYYVDGVYNPNPTSATMTLNNVDRVEVLKGPQGTLFGRNTTGGVIHIVTKDPKHVTSGSAEIGYGNYDTMSARFYGTTGIAEHLAADLAIVYEDQQDGFGRNVFFEKDRIGTKDVSLRSKWLWTPTDATEVRAAVSYADNRTGIGLDRDIAPGAYGVGGLQSTGDWQDVNMAVFAKGNTVSRNASVHLTQSFDRFDFISISGYRNDDWDFQYPQTGSALNAVGVFALADQETFSQELQLASNSNGKIQWLVGLYYFTSDAEWSPLTLTSEVGAFGPFDQVQIYSKQNSESFAGFGQMSWHFTDRTRLTLGARWSRDKIKLSGQTDFLSGGSVAQSTPRFESTPGFDNTATFKEPTYRIALDHHFSDDLMAYASFNRGNKTGLFNLIVTSAPGENVEPEILEAYEVGVKADLFSRRLRVNATAFYYDFSDMQLSVTVVGGTSNRNAASATIKGGEIEATAQLTDRLSIQSGIAILDSKCVFRPMPAPDSAACRPPIPRHAGRGFRGMPAPP